MNEYQLLENPTDSEIEITRTTLASYNDAMVEPLEKYAFAIIARNNQQCFLGGIYCHVARKWLYIDELAIKPAARNQNVGSELLARAENAARARNCQHAWLTTYSFEVKLTLTAV